MKEDTLYSKYKKINKVGTKVDVPFEVWSLFGESGRNISVLGEEISLSGDYASLEKCRKAIAWYVQQLGGKVEWSNE